MTHQGKNIRISNMGESSKKEILPIPINKQLQKQKQKQSDKEASKGEYGVEPPGRFATFNSKIRQYSSTSDSNNSSKSKPNLYIQPISTSSTFEEVETSPISPTGDSKKGSFSTSVPGELSLLQRSITVGSRSINKMKSFSNFRSPESGPQRTLSPTEILAPCAEDSSSDKANKLLGLPPTNTSKQLCSKQSSEESQKESPKKLRSARSEFFSTSTKTFTAMLPKMDKLNLFSKTGTVKGHKFSRSTTEKPPSPTAPTTSMLRSESERDESLKGSGVEIQHIRLAGDPLPATPADEENEEVLCSDQILGDNKIEGFISQELFVYGALFSEISYHLYKLLTNQGQFDWPKIFSGREAVDLLCTIIGTDDRKLALFIGRALDAQNFITHVSKEHRLRDSSYESYKLDSHLESLDMFPEDELHDILPNGVFTPLTDCYSPTCSPENRCYSISCPRRLESIVAEEDIPQEIANSQSESSKEEEQLWERFAPPDVVASVSERERKRQEVIFELIYTERDFVSDLKVIQEAYLMPLLCGDIIPNEKRDDFIKEVFINILDIQKSSFKLSAGLQELQAKAPVIQSIGQFFLDHMACFEPFIEYGSNQVYSKRRLAKEIKDSPELEEFLKVQARLPECRKLPIQSFLARATTRLGRYPLLLEAILKYTEEGNSDCIDLPKVVTGIKEVLSEVNIRAGVADNRVRLDDILSHLSGPSESIKELGLTNSSRSLIREGVLKKKSGVELIDVYIFLFDSHFLMTKKRKSTKYPDQFEYKISKKPIRLNLLTLSDHEENSFTKAPAAGGMPLTTIDTSKTTQFPLTITHLGRQGGSYTLYCSTLVDRQRWKSTIIEQQDKVLQKSMVFLTRPLANKNSCPVPGIFCSAICDSNHTLLLGTDVGIYAKKEHEAIFSLIIELDRVKKIEVLEEQDLLLVLGDRTLYCLSLSLALKETRESRVNPEKLKSNIDFFSVGTCLGRTLICAIKTTALSTTGRLYQPTASASSRKSIQNPKSFLTSIGSKKSVEFFKEFYIPSESFNVYFLKSKLCVACAKGFEVLDLASLLPQGLLNPTDLNLEFVFSRGETVKPIAFFRIRDGVFFVCYDEFGFFVDRAGQLEVSAHILYWKGAPRSFSMYYPYILAFDPSFVEVRSLETGELQQILHTNHTITLRTGLDAIHLLDQAHIPDAWQLKELILNRNHPSNVTFRKNLKDARVTKRRGMIGSYSNS